MSNILTVFWIILILYIWLETDAFFKWAKLFKIKPFYKDYEERLNYFSGLKYIDYLMMKFPRNFFINLITCQECLVIWLNILCFICFSQQLGGWLYFGINTLASIWGIAWIKSSLKNFYE